MFSILWSCRKSKFIWQPSIVDDTHPQLVNELYDNSPQISVRECWWWITWSITGVIQWSTGQWFQWAVIQVFHRPPWHFELNNCWELHYYIALSVDKTIKLLQKISFDDIGRKKAPKSRQCREKYILKRRRRKLNARISALKERDPLSANIATLTKEVGLLTFEISELITKQLNDKESKAVSTIKSNPRFFYSYAKRFAKTKSSVAPIRDHLGILHTEPAEKAELLQSQYTTVFSDPNSANIDHCLEDLNPLPKN